MNRDFEETCSVSADLRSVLFMLFNPVKDELITGGVGGTKVRYKNKILLLIHVYCKHAYQF